MEKECGMWINILSHKLKKRMNANMQSLGPVSYTHLDVYKRQIKD